MPLTDQNIQEITTGTGQFEGYVPITGEQYQTDEQRSWWSGGGGVQEVGNTLYGLAGEGEMPGVPVPEPEPETTPTETTPTEPTDTPDIQEETVIEPEESDAEAALRESSEFLDVQAEEYQAQFDAYTEGMEELESNVVEKYQEHQVRLLQLVMVLI